MSGVLRALSVALLAISLVTSAQGNEKEEERLISLAQDGFLQGQARVQRIVDPIRIAGAPLCDKRLTPVLGLFAFSRHQFTDISSRNGQEVMIEKFGLGQHPKVLHVVPGLAADRAGLQVGDEITAIDGQKIKRRLPLERWANRNPESSSLTLQVQRNGLPRDVEIEVEWGCAVEGYFHPSPSWNAAMMFFGDQTGVYLYEGLLRAQKRDEEVAVVVGHEIAHFILVNGGTERTEAEADYLGLYIVARSGYEISSAPAILEELTRKNPFSTIDPGFSTSHPQSVTRAKELEATIAEIDEKRASGSPLVPNANRWSLNRPEIDQASTRIRNEQLREEALIRFRAVQKRIADVAYRLSLAGGSVCHEETAPIVGAVVGRHRNFSATQKEQIKAAFGISGDGVTVFAVADDSPASRAGLRPGDQILRINGSKVKRTKHVFDKVRKSKENDPVLRIRRNEIESEVTMDRVLGCAYGVLVVPGGSIDVSAHRNRTEIVVSTGILGYVEDDDELAFELSHQMGHNILNSFRSGRDEPRADELGLRIASLAGYDVSKAPAYWDRKSALQSWQISSDMGSGYVTHGAMSLRAPVIRKTVEELQAEGAPDSNFPTQVSP